MTDLERQLTEHLQRRAAAATPRYDLEAIYRDANLPYQLDGQQPHPAPRHRRRWTAVGVAAAVAVVAAFGVIASRDDGTRSDVATSPGAPADPLAGHWFAFAAEDPPTGRATVIDVHLVRDGEPPRRVELPGSDTRHEVCPAFSPTGSGRLMIGRVGDQEHPEQGPELLIVQVEDDGSVTPELTIPLEELGSATPAQPQDGDPGIFHLRSGPCAIWSPDGNWAALGGGGAVWVVDTNTGDVRQLPGYHPTDLEWRPGTDELAITGNQTSPEPATDTPVDIYTASTGQIRALGTTRATHLTWSPDGTTLAFTHGQDRAFRQGQDRPDSGIWLVDADGTNERQLTERLGDVGHGTGVTWSPDGALIAYQRWCGDRCGEGHEVVLVTATDQNAGAPIGTETVIPPPRTASPAAFGPWYPWHVTWSPDATHLVYLGWQAVGSRGPSGLLAVPVRSAGSPVVISGDLGVVAYDGTPWVPLQPWGPR